MKTCEDCCYYVLDNTIPSNVRGRSTSIRTCFFGLSTNGILGIYVADRCKYFLRGTKIKLNNLNKETNEKV